MSVPIIFVTSRDTSADELLSIQAGGIDFITKPYDTLILLEKIKRALQLSNPNNFGNLQKDCTLDLHLSVLKYEGKSIELTRNEFRILYYFFMNEDKIISKEELLEKLWNDKYYLDENVLLVNMTRLKKKMKEIGIIHLLENIRGKGGSCELLTFLEGKISELLFQIFFLSGIVFLLIFYDVDSSFIILSAVLFLSAQISFLWFSFQKKQKDSQRIINLADELQESYYISDILPKPGDLQNKAYYYALKKRAKL